MLNSRNKRQLTILGIPIKNSVAQNDSIQFSITTKVKTPLKNINPCCQSPSSSYRAFPWSPWLPCLNQ